MNTQQIANLSHELLEKFSCEAEELTETDESGFTQFTPEAQAKFNDIFEIVQKHCKEV